MITIVRTVNEMKEGRVYCYFEESVESATGPKVVQSHVILSEFDAPLTTELWGNDDLIRALAAALVVDPKLITAAVPPPVVEAVVEEAPAPAEGVAP